MTDQLVPILMYHSISQESAPAFRRWTIGPKAFTEQMALLHALGYTTLSVTQFACALRTPGSRLPEQPVVVTFDDGFADFYETAFPVLQKWGFSASLYISTGFIGGTSGWLRPLGEGRRPMLTWPQIREIDKAGIECGAHCVTHPQLDVIPRAEAFRQIEASKAVLEHSLGHEVSTFAYPHGFHDSAVRQMVIDARFSSACAVKDAMSGAGDDVFALARIIVHPGMTIGQFRATVEGKALGPAPAHERIVTRAYRIYRRATAALAERRHVNGTGPRAEIVHKDDISSTT